MSGTKARAVSYQIITAGVMTGTSVINSSEIDVSGSNKVAIEISFTGTPNGTFQVQGAVRVTTAGLATPGGTNFQNITLSSAPTATGAAGSHLIQLSDLAVTKLRLQYTNSSSTGTLDAWVTVKGE